MTVQLKRVNGTSVFFANTSVSTKGVGTLNEAFLSILNPDRGVFNNLIDFRLNGHKLATIRTRAVNNKTTIVTLFFGKEIRGLTTARFRITTNGDTTNVSGNVDGKQIVPFTIRCSKGKCKGPDSIKFKNGGTLTITVSPQLERALRLVSNKLSKEVQAFLDKLPPQGACEIACIAAGAACAAACSVLFPPCLIACYAAQAACLLLC
ncbi:hypothetical protein [Paenibacillus andongensis]|uniref:hypothetical protein n=1 Tax=Paenibacillus andongensis TaxID=2975482 RepID=UPI0021BB0783|nr:hypothetical protein [Paenibacillus andongensis]